jgi:hypothetical protein
VIATGPWESFDVHVTQHGSGPQAVRHDTGVWCTVLLSEVDHASRPGDGVVSVEWTPVFGWEDRTDLSAGLRAVLDAICL